MAPAQPELKKVCHSLITAILTPFVLCDRDKPNASFHLELLLTLRSQYLDKRLFVQLNGSRKVIGVLRGYDVRKTDSA